MLNEKLEKGIHGFYKMKTLDDNGNVIKETEWVHNAIVKSYAFALAELFLNAGNLTNNTPVMAIGTDGAAVVTSQKKLLAEHARSQTEVIKSIYEEGAGMYVDGDNINCIDIQGIFEKGIECDIKEIGIFWGKDANHTVANSGHLFSRKALPNGWDKPSDVRAIFVYRLLFVEV